MNLPRSGHVTSRNVASSVATLDEKILADSRSNMGITFDIVKSILCQCLRITRGLAIEVIFQRELASSVRLSIHVMRL